MIRYKLHIWDGVRQEKRNGVTATQKTCAIIFCCFSTCAQILDFHPAARGINSCQHSPFLEFLKHITDPASPRMLVLVCHHCDWELRSMTAPCHLSCFNQSQWDIIIVGAHSLVSRLCMLCSISWTNQWGYILYNGSIFMHAATHNYLLLYILWNNNFGRNSLRYGVSCKRNLVKEWEMPCDQYRVWRHDSWEHRFFSSSAHLHEWHSYLSGVHNVVDVIQRRCRYLWKRHSTLIMNKAVSERKVNGCWVTNGIDATIATTEWTE